jgi:hypothetical protein
MSIPFSASIQKSIFFTPTMIPSLALWFDASDPTTITQSSGTVSEWRDKSSNAYSVIQGTVGNRPTYATNLLNGLPGIQLSATSYLYQVGSSMPNFSSSPATTVYMVAKNGSSMPNWNIINTMWFTGISGGTQRYHFSFGYLTTNGITLFAKGAAVVNPSAYVVPLNSNAIIGFSSSATSNFIFYNGSNTAYASSGALPSANNATWFLFGDARLSTPPVTDENIYEFVGFNTVLTTAQQQLVEGYLATKWGLQSSLSNGHPYKTTPLYTIPTLITPATYPTSVVYNPEFEPRLIEGCQLWLDGADTTTISFSTGSNVSTWTDKSGNGLNATVYAGTPTYTVASGVTFNGSSSLQVTYPASPTLESLFVIIRFNSVSAQGNIFSGIASGQREYLMYSPYSPGTIYLGRHSTGPSGSINGGTVTTGTTYMLEYVFNGTGNTIAFYQSGTVTSSGVPQFTYSVGGSTTLIGPYNGQIYEMIVYNTALNATQRQQVEAYLAKKWKISALSTQNIYAPGSYLTFVNAPYVPIPPRRAVQGNKFLPSQIAGLQLWLDAADPSTFTYSSGSNITTWIDKSPGANNVTTLTGTPSYTTDGNLKVVNFKSGDLLRSAFTFTITTSSAFFIVAKLTSTSTAYPMVLALPDNNSGDYSIRYSGSVVNFGNSDDIGNGNYFTNGAPNTNASFLNLYVIIDTTTATRAASSRISISGSFSSRFFIGNVAEVLVYPGGVNSTQRSQIQGYLGWKWKLKPEFPRDHPFFFIPPVPLP